MEGPPGGTSPLIEVVTLLHILEGRLLMARSRGRNGFYLPGGKIDAGETAIEALHREIREELSAEIVEGSLVPFGHYVEQAFGQPEGVMVSARAFVGSLNRAPIASNEIDELRYFTAEEYGREIHRAATSEAVIRDLRNRGMMA